MSEISNDVGAAGASAETIAADDTRMAMPSHADIARGAAPAVWGDDPGTVDQVEQPSPERAADYSIGRVATALGLPEETIEGARAWLAGETQFTSQQLATFDTDDSVAAQAELEELWGADKLVGNLKRIDAYLDTLPGNAGVVFRAARNAQGRALANDPAALVRVFHASQGSASLKFSGDLNAQIAEVERMMRTDRKAYDRNELLQARYRELLTMRERQQ